MLDYFPDFVYMQNFNRLKEQAKERGDPPPTNPDILHIKVRGAGLSSQLLFPMLTRPHFSNVAILRRKHQLVEVFKAK